MYIFQYFDITYKFISQIMKLFNYIIIFEIPSNTSLNLGLSFINAGVVTILWAVSMHNSSTSFYYSLFPKLWANSIVPL